MTLFSIPEHPSRADHSWIKLYVKLQISSELVGKAAKMALRCKTQWVYLEGKVYY